MVGGFGRRLRGVEDSGWEGVMWLLGNVCGVWGTQSVGRILWYVDYLYTNWDCWVVRQRGSVCAV